MNRLEYKKLGLTYTVTQTFTSGIELLGFEVKSLKTGLGSLDGSKVIVRGGECFAVGVYIPAHQEKNAPASYDPYRTRKLLLNKREIEKLAVNEQEKDTLVPTQIFLAHNLVKVQIAVCKKLKKQDKREKIKEKDFRHSV